MQRLLVLATGFGLAVLSALSVEAQDRPKAKAKAKVAERLDAAFFDRLDANKDGIITMDEVPAERRERAKQLFDRLDADKDGKLTRKEFEAGLDRARRKSDRPEEPKPAGRPDAPPNERRPEGAAQGERRPEGTPTAARRPEGQPPGERRPDEPRRPGDNPPAGRPPFDGEPGRPPFGGPDLFRALDTDNDQKLSKDELAKAVELILKFDKNGDGFVTPEELAEALRGVRPNFGPAPGAPGTPRQPGATTDESRARLAAMIQRADKNGDGKLSKDECPELLRNRFDEIDKNKDGFIDATELAQVAANPRRPEDGAPGGPPFPGGPFAPGGPLFPGRPGAGGTDRPGAEANIAANRERIAAMLRERDKDADGRISASEFGADRADEFKRLDTNGDGYLTPDELARSLAPRDSDRPERDRRPEGAGQSKNDNP